MKQFRYRPPSAGRSLIRNSDEKEDEENKILKKEEEVNENKILTLRAIISRVLRDILL